MLVFLPARAEGPATHLETSSWSPCTHLCWPAGLQPPPTPGARGVGGGYTIGKERQSRPSPFDLGLCSLGVQALCTPRLPCLFRSPSGPSSPASRCGTQRSCPLHRHAGAPGARPAGTWEPAGVCRPVGVAGAWPYAWWQRRPEVPPRYPEGVGRELRRKDCKYLLHFWCACGAPVPGSGANPLSSGLCRDPGLHAGFVLRSPQLGLQQPSGDCIFRLLWDWPPPAAAADGGHRVHGRLGGVVPAGGLPARAGLRHLPAAGAGGRGTRWPSPGGLAERVRARAPDGVLPGRGRGPESSGRGGLQLWGGRADSTWRPLCPGSWKESLEGVTGRRCGLGLVARM